jgi:hypothetical protein
MSFDPRVTGWFARYAPHVVRGLVITDEGKRTLLARRNVILRSGAHGPSFWLMILPTLTIPSCVWASARVPVLTWTVRTPDDARRAAAYADAPIAEGAVLHMPDHAGPITQNRPQHHDSGGAGRTVGGGHRARRLGPSGRP